MIASLPIGVQLYTYINIEPEKKKKKDHVERIIVIIKKNTRKT